ncbi:retrovirus-related pol polyprotein from transposon TNT 1-94 [Tanacetum coccineum]
MIIYSALCDNYKQHRKKIDEQEILFDKMSHQLVEMNNNVLRLQEKILEKETKISELEECVRNKDLEIAKCFERVNDCEDKLHKIGQTRQTIHMIMPSEDKMYNGRKGIGFENPSYFCKAKELRPNLYNERVIGLGYTPMFLTHWNETLEIDKFKRARENKIEFAYDYGNLNASYVNEKINFLNDYFQEIINPDFEKIDSPFQQTSSLKPYVPTVILEKIIIDLEDEVASLLEKEKENLEIIESLKSKGSKSSENAIYESENQSENDCHVFKKGCDNLKNSKVIAPGMSNSNKSLPRTMFRWLPKMQPLAEPVAKWIPKIFQICLWIIDSRCSKHMTGNRALLTNFVEKFLGTVSFGNNNFAVIAGYGDVVIGSMTIKKVYYVEGLGHNLFSVGQFYDKGLEVAFRKSTCFVRNEDGVDLLIGDRSSNLYTIDLNEITSNSSACLLAKASSSQSWLWHQHLSHLNFSTINNLVKNNLFRGLPKMKFEKDHFCSACEQGKIHQKHHKSKMAFTSNKPLYLLHMNLCGPMRVESIKEKRYVLVVVDDYSRYTWRVQTDNGTEFKNKNLAKFFDETVKCLQMDVKKAFLNGILKKEVCVGQPPGFVSKQYPNHVYALDKARYGLKQAPRAWLQVNQFSNEIFINQSNYILDILKRFGMENYDTVPTPMVEQAKLKLDLVGKLVDHTDYRSLWYPKDFGFDLTSYSDADHAGCHLDRKTESEYVVVSGCCTQVLWMCTQLTDYGFFYDKVTIYCDSKSAIAISCNPVQHTRTKHVDVRYHFINDHIEKGTIELYFVGTEFQLADLFMKSLPETRFKFLVEKLGMMSRET